MKKSKFTEAQIIGILNEQIQQDQKVAEVCRKHGISSVPAASPARNAAAG
ncbi:MAG: transposase [Flammeovirgaceae bacterium]|nr:MAG: transposase [Flammeovirgaceae bacterium]